MSPFNQMIEVGFGKLCGAPTANGFSKRVKTSGLVSIFYSNKPTEYMPLIFGTKTDAWVRDKLLVTNFIAL